MKSITPKTDTKQHSNVFLGVMPLDLKIFNNNNNKIGSMARLKTQANCVLMGQTVIFEVGGV